MGVEQRGYWGRPHTNQLAISLDRNEYFEGFITCKRTNNANIATRYVKLGKKRRESSGRNYYTNSPRVIIQAIIINFDGIVDRAQFFTRASKQFLHCWLSQRTPRARSCWRDWFVVGDELCGKCWALSRRTFKSWVTSSYTHATKPSDKPCLCISMWVGAVEAVLQRLLFQFKYMPPHELLDRRLAGRDIKDSNDLQGTAP